jgi:type II secretory pathway component PulM
LAIGISSWLDDLKASLRRLSPREKQLLGGLSAVVFLGIVVLIGYFVLSGLEEIELTNTDIRKALRDIEKNKDSFLQQRKRLAALEVRMSRTPLELNRFIETAASAVGVSITESGEVAPVQGERYIERGMEVKLRKVSIEQLAKLMKELEGSPHIVQITRLSVTPRFNQHQDLDVEMVVSTFERRTEPTPGAPGAGAGAPGRAREKAEPKSGGASGGES